MLVPIKRVEREADPNARTRHVGRPRSPSLLLDGRFTRLLLLSLDLVTGLTLSEARRLRTRTWIAHGEPLTEVPENALAANDR